MLVLAECVVVLMAVRRCAEGLLEWRRWCCVCVCVLCALRWFHASLADQSVCLQDGKSVVSGSRDKTVRVWDAATGKEVQKLEGHSDYVNSVAFSPVRRRRARGRQLRAWCAWSVCIYVYYRVNLPRSCSPPSPFLLPPLPPPFFVFFNV